MAYQLKSKCRVLAASVVALVALCRCGAGVSTTEVWTESVIGVWGGTIQATQGDGSVAYVKPDLRSGLEMLRAWMNPFPEALAAVPDCPLITAGTCLGPSNASLQVLNNGCFGAGKTLPLYRRHYVTWNFPLAADCTAVQGAGFTSGTIAGLVGKTVTRGYGYSNTDQSADQVNFALASNNELNAVYTIFPSGWLDDTVVGGIDVTFVDANTRKITIKGIHIQGDANTDTVYENADGLDLADKGQFGNVKNHLWDHTLKTVKNGDVIFNSGPGLSASSGGVSFAGDDVQSSPSSPADADATVVGFGNGATLKKGAAVRVQHNHSSSIGVSVVTEDLVFGDSKCCWPTAGKIHTEFDRFYDGTGKMPWPYEDISFSSPCGSIHYETSEGDTGVSQLHHCY